MKKHSHFISFLALLLFISVAVFIVSPGFEEAYNAPVSAFLGGVTGLLAAARFSKTVILKVLLSIAGGVAGYFLYVGFIIFNFFIRL